MSEVKHFLLVFDHAAGHLRDVMEYGGDAKAALSQYEDLEEQYRENHQMDIVLVGSDSLDTVKVTHANYFDAEKAEREIRDYLESITRRERVSR